MVSRNVICVALCIVLTFALAACGKTSGQPAPQNATSTQNASSGTAASSNQTSANAVANTNDTAGAKLLALNAKDGESPILRAVALDGNRAGKSIEEGGHFINGRPLSTDNIRNVFELNEWISFRLDADKNAELTAVIIPHEDDPAKITESFMQGISDDAPRLALQAPENADDDMASWGETYLHVDYWKPGDYDLVFLSGTKPIARITLKFYPERELENLSDPDLDKLMRKLAN